jgi:tetratricopeptide (TPR) repeat protein
MVRLSRAWARLTSDDSGGALADIEPAISVARGLRDPHTLFATLGNAAYMYSKLDRLDEARSLAREMLDADPQAPCWSSGLVLVAGQLGLGDEIRSAFAQGPHSQRREPFFVAAAEQRFVEAAELAVSKGDLDVATDLRMVAASALLEHDLTAEAAEQLELALAFYRSVRATRMIREIEAQLAEIQSTVG